MPNPTLNRRASRVKPISDLAVLLKSLQPVLNPGTYAYATLKPGQVVMPSDLVALILEPEGTSVIVNEKDLKRLGLDPVFRCAWITLTVTSDLQAVGLTAAFSSALGASGISCNVVAGTHHDHIFVPADRAEEAMQALRALQSRAASAQAL